MVSPSISDWSLRRTYINGIGQERRFLRPARLSFWCASDCQRGCGDETQNGVCRLASRLLFAKSYIETFYLLREQQGDVAVRTRTCANNSVGALRDDIALPHAQLTFRSGHFIDRLEPKLRLRGEAGGNVCV